MENPTPSISSLKSKRSLCKVTSNTATDNQTPTVAPCQWLRCSCPLFDPFWFCASQALVQARELILNWSDFSIAGGELFERIIDDDYILTGRSTFMANQQRSAPHVLHGYDS